MISARNVTDACEQDFVVNDELLLPILTVSGCVLARYALLETLDVFSLSAAA
jgi:hypothetical protein